MEVIEKTKAAGNPWAPFESSADFEHTVCRLTLSLSRSCSSNVRSLHAFASEDDGNDILASSTLDSHMDSLPCPPCNRCMIEGSGYAAVDVSEYLHRIFLCNPLLLEKLRKNMGMRTTELT